MSKSKVKPQDMKRSEITQRIGCTQIKKILRISQFGNPKESFYFTNEWSVQAQGYYKAMRNKKIVYAPIYKSNAGNIVIDMTQVVKEKPK